MSHAASAPWPENQAQRINMVSPFLSWAFRWAPWPLLRRVMESRTAKRVQPSNLLFVQPNGWSVEKMGLPYKMDPPFVCFFVDRNFEVIVQLQRWNRGSARCHHNWHWLNWLNQNEWTWSKAITVTFAIDQPSQAKRLTGSKWCFVPTPAGFHRFHRTCVPSNAPYATTTHCWRAVWLVMGQAAAGSSLSEHFRCNNTKKFEENCFEKEIEGGYSGQRWGLPQQ